MIRTVSVRPVDVLYPIVLSLYSFPVSGAIPQMLASCCNRTVYSMLMDNFQASQERPSTSLSV